jgi:hypothetical protein
LDLLSTLSLIFEIPMFSNLLFSSDNEETTSLDSSAQQSDQLKAGKASRAGAKAGRLVKIIRMVRLIRLVKLFKYAEQVRGRTLRGIKEEE